MLARMMDGPAKGQFVAFEHNRETVSVVILPPPVKRSFTANCDGLT